MAKISGDKAIEELKVLIDEIENVRQKQRMSAKFKKWHRDTEDMLEKIFGRSSKQVKDFGAIKYNLASFSNQTPESAFDEAFQQGLKNAAICLSSAVKDLKKGPTPKKNSKKTAKQNSVPERKEKSMATSSENNLSSMQQAIAQATEQSMTQQSQPARANANEVKKNNAPSVNKTFLLYAYDSELQNEVSSFLTKVGISPVILQDQPSHRGKLVTNLSAYDDVSYAIVVLDPDHGGLTQETIFDLGVLVGRIGNDRICGLAMSSMVELPAFAGISYVPYDGMGAWKFMLIKQLKSAGFNVDANLAL